MNMDDTKMAETVSQGMRTPALIPYNVEISTNVY